MSETLSVLVEMLTEAPEEVRETALRALRSVNRPQVAKERCRTPLPAQRASSGIVSEVEWV